jgi:adenosylcobinamide-GDP ribazoletransferase
MTDPNQPDKDDKTGAAGESADAPPDPATGKAAPEAGPEPGPKPGPQASATVNSLAAWQRDFWLCLGFFTRLPAKPVAGSLAEAGRAFPLAGMVVGLVGGLVYYLGFQIGLSALLAALLAVAATGIVTGALHEDGLADVCDALGARGGVAKRLEILRDSRLGSYGGLALVFATAIKVASLAALAAPELVGGALIAAHALSRGVLPLVMSRMDLARPEGLAAGAGRPSPAVAYWSLIIALVIAIIAVAPVAALVALLAALAATWLVARLAQRQFGGYTGDVLGAIEQLAEMAILINLVTLI